MLEGDVVTPSFSVAGLPVFVPADEKGMVFVASFPHGHTTGGDAVLRLAPHPTSAVAHDTAVRVSYTTVAEAAAATPAPSITPTILIAGQPTQQFVNFRSWNYYAMSVPLPFNRVEITVTPNTGDPDLYVNIGSTQRWPTAGNSSYASSSIWGSERVTILPNDTAVAYWCPGATGVCQLSIGIYGFKSANYSIVAVSDADSTILTPGVPFLDGLGSWSYNYYTLKSEVPGAVVTIAVTPFSGDPDLVVGTSAQPGQTRPTANNASSYCLASFTSNRDVVEIHPASPCYCAPPCEYYIGVLSWNAPATYSLMASMDANATDVLLDGVPQAGFVALAETSQYSFTFSPNDTIFDAGGDGTTGRRVIDITLVPEVGDTDLYVTLDGTLPGPGHSQYSSSTPDGTEKVTIRTTDPIFRKYCNPSMPTCTLLIAAYGFTSSSYTITATAGRYIQLQNGQPVTDAVNAGEFVYYRFTSSPGLATVVTVSPLSGDPDLYIGSDANYTATHMPTSAKGSYFWRSMGLGAEIIAIEPGSAGSCEAPCTYYIGVTGFRRNSTFIVTAKTKNTTATALVLGQPQVDVLDRSTINRYTATWVPARGPLSLSVSPQNGDPDLLVRLDNATVTPTFWQYRSAAPSGSAEQLTIPKNMNDSIFLSSGCGENILLPCTANIGVYGFSASQYIIVASVGYTQLQPGVAIPGQVAAGDYAYFYYDAPTTVPFTITVSPISGDPDVYITTADASRYPNATNKQWSSAGFGTERVTIAFDPNDPRTANLTTPARFYIGVTGFGRPAFFTVAVSGGQAASLPNGVPVRGSAAPWSFSYFTFVAPASAAGQPLEFVATPLGSGDVSLYVTNKVDPVTGVPSIPRFDSSCKPPGGCPVVDYIWSSAGSVSRERVVVPAANATFNTYVVGVLASSTTAADFALVGSVSGSIVLLEPGVPLEDMATRGEYNYYRLMITDYEASVSITVTPFTGDPDLYVSVHAGNPYPNATKSDKRSTRVTGAEAVYFNWLELPECIANIPAPGSSGSGSSVGFCTVYIGVRAFSNTTYTVTGAVSIGNSSITLLDGVPQTGQVLKGQMQYYTTEVDIAPTDSFSVLVRSSEGDADLYCTTDGSLPTTNNYQFKSAHFGGDDFISVSPGVSGYNNTCTLRCGVYGFIDATYVITYASAAIVQQLSDGQSSVGSIAGAGVYDYYYLSVLSPDADVTFSLTALAGDPDLYVAVWSDPTFRPTAGNSTWSGTFYGSDVVSIPATDPDSCSTACNYIVGVSCSGGSSCRYALTGTTQISTLTSLSNGSPLSSTVPPGGYRYYTFNVGGNAQAVNLTVRVTSSQGNAEAYITNNYVPTDGNTAGLPSNNPAGGFVWGTATGGDSLGSGVITIPSSDPSVRANATLYTIAVYGVNTVGVDSAYTITVSTSAVAQVLVPGQQSTRQSVPYFGGSTYVVTVDDPSQDLIVSVTELVGNVMLAVSSVSSNAGSTAAFPACSPVSNSPGTPNNATCSGVWSTFHKPAGSANQMRIPASNPCGSPFATGPCSAANWPSTANPSMQFYITVFGLSAPAASYGITVSTSKSYEWLADGEPQEGTTADDAWPVYGFQTPYDPRKPDIKFTLASDNQPLEYYITSCKESVCNASVTTPGPYNFQLSGVLDAQSSVDVFITKLTASYCSDSVGRTRCNYLVAVLPVCTAPCSGTFTIQADLQSGGGADTIYAASVANRVAPFPGNVPQGSSALYELFLDPSQTVSVTTTLDACGPGTPSLYVCNPSAANKCVNPFNPSHTDNTGSASTGANGVGRITSSVKANTFFIAVAADAPSSALRGDGRALAVGDAPAEAEIVTPAEARLEAVTAALAAVSSEADKASLATAGLVQEQARLAAAVEPAARRRLALEAVAEDKDAEVEALSAAVLAAGTGAAVTAGSGRALATGNQQYVLTVSTGTSKYLNPPSTPMALTVDGTSITVTWSPATVTDQNGASPVNAQDVTYYIYAAAGGFTGGSVGAGNGVVPTTACGLFRWGSLAKYDPTAIVDTFSATLTGLDPSETYQVGILAECARACWTATLPSSQLVAAGKMSREEAEALSHEEARALLGGDPSTLGAVPVQRIAFPVGTATTGAGGSTPASSGSSATSVVGAIFGVLAAAGGGFLYYRYRKSKKVDREYQYVSMPGAAAMDTIATPTAGVEMSSAAPYGAMSGGGSGGSSSVRGYVVPTVSGSGIFSSLKRKVTGGHSTHGRVALADTEYSSVDDQVSGFL